MNFKSFFLAGAVSLAALTTGFSKADTGPSDQSLEAKIKKELSNFNLDYNKLEGATLKIRFMLNEKSEILVLSTNNSELDKSVKMALNYDKVEARDLKPFEIYVVPVKFTTK